MSSSPAGQGASATAHTPARPARLAGCGPGRGHDRARGRYPALRGPAVIRESLQGKYAGFASRFAAFAADVGVSAGAFMLALAAISWAARVLTGKNITWNKGDIWVIIAYAAWGSSTSPTAGPRAAEPPAWHCSACES